MKGFTAHRTGERSQEVSGCVWVLCQKLFWPWAPV